MRLRFSTWIVLLLLAFPVFAEAETTTPLEPWYPFLSEGKWGFIDAQGAWKIAPAYDGEFDIFDHDLVRVVVKGNWGYINRQGQWVIKPQFDSNFVSPYFEYGNFQAVSYKKRFGIVNRQGEVVLPMRYDDVILSSDRAWVREGNRLGIFGLDGHWIRRPDISWPAYRTTPKSLNADGVAWFQELPDADGKWGLIDSVGKIVFTARFLPRPPNAPEQVWPEPKDMQFVDGHALVFENGGFESVSTHGEIGVKLPFRTVRPWAGNLFQFTDRDGGNFGLVSSTGSIVLPAQACEIKEPVDGLARYFWKSWAVTGFLNSEGQPIIPAGKFGWLTEAPSEGLIAASRQAKRSSTSRVSDPRGIFLDLTGKEVPITNDTYYAVGSFSDGLAAVRSLVEVAPGSTPGGGTWGYIDQSGAMKIPSQFGSASRFCRGRAWVSQKPQLNGSPIEPHYALIDESSKVLTDYQFMPPESDRQVAEVATPKLPEFRWRGDLIVLDRGWQIGLGLAKADGTILIPAQFNSLGPLSDGMIQCIRNAGEDSGTGYIDAQGKIVIPPTYSRGTDFEDGSAWVTYQPIGRHFQGTLTGWSLIDHRGQVLSKDLYVSPSFIAGGGYRDLGLPLFMGKLACVASAATISPSGSDRLRKLSWGYVDRAGKVVAWHKAEAN